MLNIGGLEVIKEMKNHSTFWVLLMKEIHNSESILSKVLHTLLNEFEYLSPEELPNEVPPLRNIQHIIDLVPR